MCVCNFRDYFSLLVYTVESCMTDTFLSFKESKLIRASKFYAIAAVNVKFLAPEAVHFVPFFES